MKKKILAVAVAGAFASGAAFAQSVVLSGSVSMGLAKSGNTKAAQVESVIGITTSNANMFQFVATEKLPGGITATAVSQHRLSAINVDAVSGDLYLDVAGGFGSVKAGKYAPNSNTGFSAFADRTITGLNLGAGVVGTNNIISYTTPNVSGFTAMLQHNPSGAAAGGSGHGIRLNYALGGLALQAAHSRAPTASDSLAAKLTTYAASYDFKVAKVFFNANDIKAGNSSAATMGTDVATLAEKGTSISVAVPMGAMTFRLGYQDKKTNTTSTVSDRTAVGIDYALSNRTYLTADVGIDKQAVTGENKRTNFFLGATHTF